MLLATMVATAQSPPQKATEPAKAVSLEIRLAELEPGPGLIRTDVPNSGVLYMTAMPLLTNRHIKYALAVLDDYGRPAIKLFFTPDGALIMQRVSREEQGKTVVFLVDGRPIMAPVITRPITEDFTLIEGFLTQEQVTRFVASFNRR